MKDSLNIADDLIENAINKHNQEIANETIKQYHKENDKYHKKGSNALYTPERICKLSRIYDNNEQIKKWMKEGKVAEQMRNKQYDEIKPTDNFVLNYIFGGFKK